jgi:hypothetical protein
MRFECKRSDAATKWYDINLMPLAGDNFAVIVTYGVKGPNGDDAILQPATGVFAGSYPDALDVVNKKIQDRLSIGYVKIEPKQSE